MTNCGVEFATKRRRPEVTAREGDVGELRSDATLFGDGKGIGVEVDTDDATRRSDKLSNQKAHITHPAADIQDTHPRTDAGGAENALRRGS